MRGKELYEKITDIDDDIVLENSAVRKTGKQFYLKTLAAAVCLGIAFFTGYLFWGNKEGIGPFKGNQTEMNPNLPKISLDTDVSGAMGFEGYIAWDISDLINANPWSEDSKLTYLPVIKNQLVYDKMQQVENADLSHMERLLKETAQNLGMDIDNIAITKDVPDGDTKKGSTEKLTDDEGQVPERFFEENRLFMEDETYKLSVDSSYTIQVEFKTPVRLPDEYNFSYEADYDEIYATAEYLREKYADFIAMENPKISISGGDYNIYAQQSYGISYYNESSDEVQNFLNYHFNKAEFCCNGDGDLFLARKYYTDLSEVEGEYPIIDIQEAQRLLENGNYITTVPEAFTNTEYIKKVELVYRTATRNKLFIPYYKFYVELPREKLENGLNIYGAYYVPAVEGQYITNMPVWDQSAFE